MGEVPIDSFDEACLIANQYVETHLHIKRLQKQRENLRKKTVPERSEIIQHLNMEIQSLGSQKGSLLKEYKNLIENESEVEE